MSIIKLGRLPDRTPIKITIAVSPQLNRILTDYAEAYEAAYGEAEPVCELIPAMLTEFPDSDRSFARLRKTKQKKS